jgi:hypothetical protein
MLGIVPSLSIAVDARMMRCELHPIQGNGFLVRTQHRARSATEEQSLDGLAEGRALEVEGIMDTTEPIITARRIDVELPVRAVVLRDADERRPEQGVPDADIEVSRADRAESDVTRSTLLTGSATANGQPPELCEYLSRRVARGNGRGYRPAAAWVPTGQDEPPEDLRWGLEYASDLRLLTPQISGPPQAGPLHRLVSRRSPRPDQVAGE